MEGEREVGCGEGRTREGEEAWGGIDGCVVGYGYVGRRVSAE